jgi:hypothetical protein
MPAKDGNTKEALPTGHKKNRHQAPVDDLSAKTQMDF